MMAVLGSCWETHLAILHLAHLSTPPSYMCVWAAGYEAETVAAADRNLKDTLGPLAYMVSGEGLLGGGITRQLATQWHTDRFCRCRLPAAGSLAALLVCAAAAVQQATAMQQATSQCSASQRGHD